LEPENRCAVARLFIFVLISGYAELQKRVRLLELRLNSTLSGDADDAARLAQSQIKYAAVDQARRQAEERVRALEAEVASLRQAQEDAAQAGARMQALLQKQKEGMMSDMHNKMCIVFTPSLFVV